MVCGDLFLCDNPTGPELRYGDHDHRPDPFGTLGRLIAPYRPRAGALPGWGPGSLLWSRRQYPCRVSAPSGRVHAADNTPARTLPSLTTLGVSPQPHIIVAPARTGTNIDLRIHTSLTAFDVAAGPWSPAAAGFAVTVVVQFVDTETGKPRHLPIAEPHEWARAIFSDIEAAQGYFLGAVDPDTGHHRDGQLAYRLYLDLDRRAIRVPRQLVACPHYRLPTVDDGPEIRIVATA